jgi:hypothetical protein
VTGEGCRVKRADFWAAGLGLRVQGLPRRGRGGWPGSRSERGPSPSRALPGCTCRLGLMVLGFGFGAECSGFGLRDSGFRGSVFMFEVLELRVPGVGCGFWGLGSRV